MWRSPTCLVLVLGCLLQAPLTSPSQDSALAESYLAKFGYLGRSSGRTASLQTLESAVESFQAFAGLPQTGLLDSETLRLMKTPRCGVKDFPDHNEDTPRIHVTRHRGKRYALQGSRWKVKELTYRVSLYPVKSRLSVRDVDETIEKAFQIWEKATGLNFVRKRRGKVHIEIRFERRNHGDDDPFDGEGGTLAHAFFPVFGGDAHFDDDEDWTVNTARGTSLLMTAAHELGHSLGLSHSNVRSSLMAPFYRGYDPNLRLEEDDIKGIQALYGSKEDNENGIGLRSNHIRPDSFRTSTTTTSKPRTFRTTTRQNSFRPPSTRATSTVTPAPVFTPTPRNEESPVNNTALCNSPHLDTVVTMKDSVTYAFQGSDYWKLTETSVEPGYPRPISEDWDGLPGDLDASFTWTNGKTYFFKGSKYWRFSDVGSMDPGYPKQLDKGFSGIPNNVDAALVWPVNDKIYFFKGSIYWKFDPDASPPVDSSSYPRPISNWDGIPSDLDSAVQYSNGKTYFFKNGRYYRFDDEEFRLDRSAKPSFPRQTSFWWFGCRAESSRSRRDTTNLHFS